MDKYRLYGTAVSIAVLCVCVDLHAGGLSTQLGEAYIENLQIGESYSLGDLASLHLEVVNTSEVAVDLRMDVLQPDEVELKGGAIPIPSTSWISLSESSFTLQSSGRAVADITISIPDDARHLGKKYQFMIWSHTLGAGGGMTLAYGLKSRIIFTLDSVRATASANISTAQANIQLSLVPEEAHLLDVVIGDSPDEMNPAGAVFKVTNNGASEERVMLRSLSVENSLASLTEGFEDTPDESFLTFDESEFLLAPGETREVKAFLSFPPHAEFCGRRYMFIVHAYTSTSRVNAGVYARLFASVSERE